MKKNAMSPASQECGLIIQQDGKPQQVLVKFITLLLNYQFGLSIEVVQELHKAVTQVAIKRNIRSVFVVCSEAIAQRDRVAALNRQGTTPLFLILPRRSIELQRQVCNGLSKVFFCAWETAFSPTGESLQEVIGTGLSEDGIGNLFADLSHISYTELQQRVERRLYNITTLPTLPEIVMRIMRLVNDPQTTTEQLEKLLCRDPAIVMKLLKVVKSPIFMGVGRTGSWTLNEIVVRLGLKKVGAIAQQIKLINSLVKPEQSAFELRRFWEHSVGCAIIADRLHLGQMLRLGAPVAFNDYWIGSLLHDIAKLVLGFFFWDWFERIMAQMDKARYRFRKAEAQLGDVVNHERLGQLMMINGDLGEGLATAVGTHHSIGAAMPTPLLCLIHLADNLCKDMGLGYLEQERGDYHPRVLAVLKLQKSDLDPLRQGLGEEIPQEVKAMVDQCL